MHKLKAPLAVGFQITGNCNLSCAYCYAHKAKPVTMSSEDALRIARDLIEMGVVSVSIEGGEPLLHPDYERITYTFLEAGLDVALLTNGTVCNQKIIKQIKNLKERYEFFTFQISLDSSIVEINEITRGRSKNVLYNLIKYSEAGIDITIGTVVHAFNIEYIFKMIEELREYVHNFHFMNLMPIAGGKYKVKGILPSQQMLKQFWLKMLEYRNHNKDLFISTPFSDFNLEFGQGVLKCNGCTAAITRATITPDLLLIPCGICPDIVLGDLKINDIREIWNNDKFDSLINSKYPLCRIRNIN